MYEQIARNRRRTLALIAGFVVIVLALGYLFGSLFEAGPFGLVIAVVIATVMSLVSYRNGDKMVLAITRARETTPADQPRLHNLVEGLAIAGGMPKPRVYIVEDSAPNAFATGRDPEHASIAVTSGLLEKMNRVELEGVIAHEMSHIRNFDTRVMAITATLVGVVVLLADWTIRSFWWGVGSRRGSREGGGAGAILVLVGLVAALLMPIFAKIIQLAVSRKREYLADASGVQLTRYPPGLISALEKLKADQTSVRTAVHATGHLWIEQPLEREGTKLSWLNRLFTTHPPLDERIRILKEM